MTTVEQSYPSRAVLARLGLLAAGLFVVGTNAFVIAGLLPEIALGLHSTEASVSLSITLYSIVVAVGAPILSIVLARVDRTRIMAAGLAIIAVGTLVAALADTVAVFDAGRVVAAVGGAALVPTATAAAPSMLPATQRGRALAIAGLGFTLATAIGSPAGTALAGIGGWRAPLFVLAALGALLAVVIAAAVRGVPIGAPIGLGARLGILKRPRLVLALVATLLLTAGFNVVYIFSAAVSSPVTGGGGGLLALLLLVYGVGGIVGTHLAGRLTDRLGAVPTAVAALAVEVVVLACLPLVDHSLVAMAVAFGFWGVAAFGAVVPVQHRLVELDPASAALSLSWYSTAMYVGIAVAPPIGAAITGAGSAGGTLGIPLAGAALGLLALGAVVLGGARARVRALAA